MLAYNAVRRVNEQGIPGDIVESGVYRGGMSCFMARSQMQFVSTAALPPRSAWLFDTFEGMPPPSKRDDKKARTLYANFVNGTTDHLGCPVRDGRWCYGPFVNVRDAMLTTAGYPPKLVRMIKGRVEET